MIFIRTILNKHFLQIMLLIVVVCVIYAILAYRTEPNSDERASLVIALGRHPSLIDSKGTPIQLEAYLDSLNYKKFPVSESNILNTTKSVVKDNSNSLFYYILLTIWIKLCGLSIFAARLLTILVTAINLGLIYYLAKCVGIRRGFRYLLILQIVVNPVFITDAILIRSYMLAMTGCMVSAISFYHVYVKESRSAKYLLFYFVGILIAFGSHYFTGSLIAGMAVALKWTNRKQFIPIIFLGYSVLFIFVGVWVWYIYPNVGNTLKFFHDQFLISKGTDYDVTIVNTVRQLLLYSANMFGMSGRILAVRLVFKLVSISLIFILSRVLYFKRNVSVYSFFSALTVLPLIFFLIQAFITGNFFNFLPHHTAFFIPFWCILLFFEIQSRVLRPGPETVSSI
jgi:uncharacterized membrane protein